jgi:hypothetical protein
VRTRSVITEVVKRCSSLSSLGSSQSTSLPTELPENAIIPADDQRCRTQSAPIEIPYTPEQKRELKKDNFMRRGLSSYDEEPDYDFNLEGSDSESSSSSHSSIPEMFIMSFAEPLKLKKADGRKRSKENKAGKGKLSQKSRANGRDKENEETQPRPTSPNSKSRPRSRADSFENSHESSYEDGKDSTEILRFSLEGSFKDADKILTARKWERMEQAYEQKADVGSIDSDFDPRRKPAKVECIFDGDCWEDFSV